MRWVVIVLALAACRTAQLAQDPQTPAKTKLDRQFEEMSTETITVTTYCFPQRHSKYFEPRAQ
jgi:hypothetical protein